MESWVSLGGKEGRTNVQALAELESNWIPCGRKAEILFGQLQQPKFLIALRVSIDFRRLSK
mgnify:CR=1 FL=1